MLRSAAARRAGGWLTAMAVAVTAALMGPAPVSHAAVTFGVASSNTQVRPTGSIAGLGTSATLTAARNESESFQIVVPGPVTITAASATTPTFGSATIYAERAYTALERSDLEGATGAWFDALVPTVDPIYHEQRNALPVTVPAGQNAALWVDVYVKPLAPAGVYSSLAITVTTSSGTFTVPVKMTVLGVTLPSTSTLRSAYMLSNEGTTDQICRAHTGTDNCGADAVKRLTLYALYARTALDNRITLANGSGLRNNQSPANYGAATWENYIEGPTIRGSSVLPADATWRLTGARATSVMQYAYNSADHCMTTCADQWEAEATEPGQDFSDQFIWYACDEPGVSVARWTACATASGTASAAWPRPRLVAATISQYDANRAASGIGDVQVLAPLVHRLWDKPNTAEAGDQRATYAAFRAGAGHSVWAYTSCMAAGCGSDVTGSPGEYWRGWPGYAIDGPANAERAMPWMAQKFGLAGELQWAVQHKLQNAWAAGGLFFEGMNGDGTFFYPGTPAQIGGTTDIPLESMRLKRIRDGYEDYELMRWLTSRGRGSQVSGIVDAVYPTAYSADATRDGDGTGSLAAARSQLNALVLALTTSRRIAFSSNRAGASGYDIWSMTATGADPVQLTNALGDERFPAWAPGARAIAYSTATDVWTMAADGSNKVNLTAGLADPAGKPAWIADGTAIAFVRTVAGKPEVWRMSPTGTDLRRLATNAYDPTAYGAGWLIYSSAGDLRKVSVTGTSDTLYLGGPTVDEVADVGDTTMTFSRSADGAQPYDVYTRNLATGAVLVNVTASAGATSNDLHSCLSADESKVAYASRNGTAGDLEIYVAKRTGGPATALTNNTAADTDPDWAPL